MAREINKFEWTSDAEDFIRETITNLGMGYAYYGKIIIKSRMIGYDKNLNAVMEYKNKFGTLYLTRLPCNAIVTNIKPELSSTF